jgi:hypothetical protein
MRCAVQIKYLNMAMIHFGASEVVPERGTNNTSNNARSCRVVTYRR